ncbi:MAG: flagellar biosynthetic protein FliO [Rhodothermales bacterium]|nr:flagellar biosynthetic protein FliO [Rhodothermales bacterium]
MPALRTALQAPRPMQRVLLLSAGLVLLFLAVQLLPTGAPASLPAADAVEEAPARPERDATRLLRPGNLTALALLAGGAGLALYLRRRRPGAAVPDALQPMGQLALGAQGELRLVRCGDDVLLLGVTAQQVHLIQRYPAAQFAPAAEPNAQASTQAEPPLLSPAFAEFLRGAATRAAQPQKAHA